MKKSRLTSMLAVMGGLTIATAACSKQAETKTEAPAGAAIADQAGTGAATGCAAKPCAAKTCGAKSCAPKGCGAKSCAAKH